MSKYLYFNKQTFKELIKVWRLLGCDEQYSDLTDEKLMDYYMPMRFIDDIRIKINEMKGATL